MSNRFKMFSTPINLSIDRIDLVVLTCCILHNFLRRLVPHYSQIDQFDIDDDSVDETVPAINLEPLDITTGNFSNDAKFVREEFVRYFNGDGAVSWQN